MEDSISNKERRQIRCELGDVPNALGQSCVPTKVDGLYGCVAVAMIDRVGRWGVRHT